VADEPSVFRDGLRALLIAQADLKVIAEASKPDLILAIAERSKPDIILLGLDSGETALSVLRALQDSNSPARVILLTFSGDSGLLTQPLRLGVSGIVSKNGSTQALLRSIRQAGGGEVLLDRTEVAEVVREPSANTIPSPRNIGSTGKPAELSRRERELVRLVTQGYRNREIADTLFISEQTVKNHMHNIFEKTKVQDRLELALYAIYHQLYEVNS
jgi:DNA-binding NarL/FixJ family response regulator